VTLELVLRARHCLSLGRLGEAEALAKAAAADAARAADALHVLGVVHLQRGRLDAAEQALRKAIAADDQVAAYHNDLGNVLQDRGKLTEAVASYRRALRLDPEFAEAWNDLGTARYARQEFEAAVKCYQSAVRLRPEHAVAYANLGAVYRKLGLFTQARQALQRELLLRLKQLARAAWTRVRRDRRLDLESPARLARLALAQLDSGNARLAAQVARRALELAPRDTAALQVVGRAELRRGRVAEALAAARAACAAQPGASAPLELLGRAAAAAGLGADAATAYQQALSAAPQSIGALRELAELQLGRGEAAVAESLLRRALELRPLDPRLHAAFGESRHRQKAFEEAEGAYRRALELDPQMLPALVRLSDVLRDSGRLDEALASAREALALDEESPLSHFAVGMAHKAKGKLDAAIESFERALAIEPRHVQAMQQLALTLREEDRMEEAEKHLRAALRIRGDDAQLLADLGVVLADTMRYEEAMRCYGRALEIAPRFVLAMNRQALLADHLGERAHGLALLEEALRLDPTDAHARFNLGLHHLKHGEYGAGWDDYEARRTFQDFIGKHRRFPLPEWDGGPLEGRTLLVLPEQGLGDEIMFGSCIAEVAARAQHVIVECDPKLEALFQRSLERCTVVSRQRTLANDWIRRVEPRPDLQVSAGSLARHFRRKPSDFPQHAYLRADPAAVAAWRARLAGLGPGRKIGLSWRGGVGYTGKKRRSLSLEQLLPLLRLPGIQYVNLQYTDVRDELRHLETRHSLKVQHWQEAIDDYDQTAALVCALDGVVTVCTAIVHLAGALGRRALVMVPFGADWRYGGAGTRMPWYPSVRMVRQPRIAQWNEVLEDVAQRLRADTWE
jgi:tetratricopeptide (TPR) repeat protein